MKKLLSILLALTMLLCLSAAAFAASEGEVTVNGTIQNTRTDNPAVPDDPDDPDPGETYDITWTATVEWYVTQNSYPEVWNTATDTNEDDPYEITNHNESSLIEVTFVSFEGTNQDAWDLADAGTLTLNLTGDLALTGDPDLSGDYDTEVTYEALMDPGDVWAYGFSGEYSAPLSTTAIEPTYTMTLSFAFA